ncbi:hypothetical protein lerEdw1_002477 [Lerista edwardsae]|nr:hypothetical protein lerEdw1_002477 [Lerista edwardsae]
MNTLEEKVPGRLQPDLPGLVFYRLSFLIRHAEYWQASGDGSTIPATAHHLALQSVQVGRQEDIIRKLRCWVILLALRHAITELGTTQSDTDRNLSQVVPQSPMDSVATFGNTTSSSAPASSSNIDEFRYQVYPTTYSIISVLGFTGNGFVLWNLRFVTERKAKLVCIAVWVFVTLVTSPFLLKGAHRDEATNKTKCLEPPLKGQMRKVLVMHYIALFVGFVLPFIVIVICCSLIIRTLLRSVVPRSRAAHKKAIWMVIIVATTFLMSFTPYHVQRTLHIHFLMRKDSSPEDTLYMQKSVVVTLSLAAFNCCFDPLLYFFSGESFRSRLSTLRSSSVLSGSRDRPPATAC